MLVLTTLLLFTAVGVACAAALFSPARALSPASVRPWSGLSAPSGATPSPSHERRSLCYMQPTTPRRSSYRWATGNRSFVDRPTIIGPVDVTYFGRIVPLNSPRANACLIVPLGSSANPYPVRNDECSDVDDQSQLTQHWKATDDAEVITLVGSTASGATYNNDSDNSFSTVLVEEDGQQVVKVVAITGTDDRFIDIRFN